MKTLYSLLLVLCPLLLHAEVNLKDKDELFSSQRGIALTKKLTTLTKPKSVTVNPNALNKITYEDGSKKEITYNSAGEVLTFKSYAEDDGNIYLDDSEVCTYNERGQLLTQAVSKYDLFANALITQWKYVYTYDDYGRLTSEIAYLVGDYAPYDLAYDTKEEYVYADDGSFEITMYNWNEGWSLDHKEKCYALWGGDWEAAPDGSSTTLYLERIDSLFALVKIEEDTWFLAGKMYFIYQDYDKLTEEYTEEYDEDGSIDSKSRTQCSYNENGDLLLKTFSNYSQMDDEWIIAIQNEFEYNDANQITMSEDRTLSWSSGNLVPTIRNTYEYDEDGNLKVKSLYFYDFANEGQLILSGKFEFTYKALNTNNIMLPYSDIGYYSHSHDFYDKALYARAAISEVKHYDYSYSTESLEYEKTGTYYYSEYTGAVNAINETKEMKVGMYPNPASDNITLKYNLMKHGSLDIYTITGQRVETVILSGNQVSVDVSHLNSGVYLFVVQDETGRKHCQQIIKE